MDLNKSWKQSNNDLTPPTTDTRQKVRATASSPIDKPHLRTLSIEERSTSETKSDGPQQRAFTPEKLGRKPNNQWVWWKHQDADPPTKSWQHPKIAPVTATPILLQHKSWQDPICYFRNVIHLETLMDLNHWMHQSKSDNSIITDRSGVPLTNKILLSTEIHFKNRMELNRNSCQHPSITWRKNLQHRKV